MGIHGFGGGLPYKRSKDNKIRQMPEINDFLSLTNLSIFSPIINSF